MIHSPKFQKIFIMQLKYFPKDRFHFIELNRQSYFYIILVKTGQLCTGLSLKIGILPKNPYLFKNHSPSYWVAFKKIFTPNILSKTLTS